MTAPATLDLNEEALRDRVARVLSVAMGRPITVTGFEREGTPFATLFPADVLRLQIDGRQALDVFLKHLGDEEQDHPDKLGPSREVSLYRDLFAGEELPVPRYLGSGMSPDTGRIELFLEYLDDWNLKYHDLASWYRAACELGRLHAWFAERPSAIEARPSLQRLGGEYAWSWARRAADEAARRGPELKERLARLLNRYGPVAEVLEGADTTLVHNDLSPKNVLADRSADPVRICFVDWECAGVGSGFLDLVNLSYGLPGDERSQMSSAYLQGIEQAGGHVPPAVVVSRLEAACSAHKALWRLAHCGRWALPEASVRDFCGEAEAAVDALSSESAGGGA